jgi:hypothetical protein
VKLLAVPLIGVVLSGCVAIPDPGNVLVVPEISGTVTRDGNPVPNVRVSYHRILEGGGCKSSKDQVYTDETGAFRISTRDEFRFWLVFGDPSNTWGICLAGVGLEVIGWRGEGIGIPPSHAEFNCELSASVERTERGVGVCRRASR